MPVDMTYDVPLLILHLGGFDEEFTISLANTRKTGELSPAFGPFQAPPTLQLMPVAPVVGAVPPLIEVDTVIVVELTLVTLPINTAVVAASR